jgi:hypothetical protein
VEGITRGPARRTLRRNVRPLDSRDSASLVPGRQGFLTEGFYKSIHNHRIVLAFGIFRDLFDGFRGSDFSRAGMADMRLEFLGQVQYLHFDDGISRAGSIFALLLFCHQNWDSSPK